MYKILNEKEIVPKSQIKWNGIFETEDSLCIFCKRVPVKRIEHLFWYCNVLMKFWENIENWIYERNQYLVNTDKKRAIFGICYQSESR